MGVTAGPAVPPLLRRFTAAGLTAVLLAAAPALLRRVAPGGR